MKGSPWLIELRTSEEVQVSIKQHTLLAIMALPMLTLGFIGIANDALIPLCIASGIGVAMLVVLHFMKEAPK